MTTLSGGPRRLRVQHSTRYHYDHTVPASYNEVRLLPRTDARQQVLEASLQFDPLTWRYDYVDYWGTSVTAFEAHTPHTELTVIGTTVTDVIDAGDCPQVDWARLRSDRTMDAYSETLVATDRTATPADLEAMAIEAAADAPPHLAAQAVCGTISTAMEYSPGSTGVQTVARRGLGRAPRRLPGLRPPRRRSAAHDRHPGALRLRLRRPAQRGRDRRTGHR